MIPGLHGMAWGLLPVCSLVPAGVDRFFNQVLPVAILPYSYPVPAAAF